MNHAPQALPAVVIPRYDALNNRAVVFAADVEPKETIKAFIEGLGMIDLPKSAYDATERLSEADQKFAAEKYKNYAKLDNVHLRARLPYSKDVSKVPSRFAVTDEMVAAAPQSQKEVLQAVQTRQKRKYTKRSEVAKQRAIMDEAASAVVNLKAIPVDAPDSAKQAAIDELSRKIAQIISSAI